VELFLCIAAVAAIIGVVHWVNEAEKRKAEEQRQAAERARAEEQRQAAEQAKAVQVAAAFQRLASDPAYLGAELARTVHHANSSGTRMIIDTLPRWPIRGALGDATHHLVVLCYGIAAAEQAGISTAFVSRARGVFADAINVVYAIGVKIVSLKLHSGDRWRKLPPQARHALTVDATRLRQLARAADALHRSLGEAIANGTVLDARRSQLVGQRLLSLADTILEFHPRPGYPVE
jgi:hypothetical protein